jgi:hypothetical protein
MTETITTKELKKILDLSIALDTLILCTITDTIIKIRAYNNHLKSKIYKCTDDDKRQIFDMINGYYKHVTTDK